MKNFYERDWKIYSAEQILEMDENKNSEIIEIKNEKNFVKSSTKKSKKEQNNDFEENEVLIEENKKISKK